ncbi:MAG: C4-type zinc ribbon domain-containing protein [Eubacteriales bacterium]|nr:C4-type zinc ribbon domain-containing protein [Eubacteriales bacterium]
MSQLDLLWEYQTTDTEADNLELSIRQSPKRQRLLKLRDYIKDQQDGLRTIESEVAAMLDRMDALKDAISLAEDQLKQLQKRVQDDPPTDSQQIAEFISEADRLTATLADYDQEVRHVRKSATDRDRRQRDAKLRAIKSKEEFDALRVEYDLEYKEKSQLLDQLRKKAEEKKKGIDPAYLARYSAIKEHSSPPMAKLVDGQCGGCNMSFPSSVLHKIRAGQQIECETCGRLILG